jgi:predicted Zn-dependent protease
MTGPDQAASLQDALGLAAELGGAISAVAAAELEAGRPASARAILEGLVVTAPREATAWALLSRTHRALGQPLAARFCAEVAAALAPEDPGVRLARAEALLLSEDERPAGRQLLASLAGEEGAEAERARALVAALGGGEGSRDA